MIPGLAQWVKDSMLLWLWCRLAATTPIRLLAWELPHAAGAALKKDQKKKKSGTIKGHSLSYSALYWRYRAAKLDKKNLKRV